MKRNREGLALVMVVLVTLVVSAMVVAMVSLSSLERRLGVNERDGEMAALAARAGVAQARAELLVAGRHELAPTPSSPGIVHALGGARFEVEVENLDGTFLVRSTGRRGGAVRRLEVRLEPRGDPRPSLEASESVSIDGELIGSLSTEALVVEPEGLIEGVVVGTDVVISSGSSVAGVVYATSILNEGFIDGDLFHLATASPLPDEESGDIIDYRGRAWQLQRGVGPSLSSGRFSGDERAIDVQDGERLSGQVLDEGGRALRLPKANVIQAPSEVDIDVVALEATARLLGTWFSSTSELVEYLDRHLIRGPAGEAAPIVKVGSVDEPVMLVVASDCHLILDPEMEYSLGETLAAGALVVHGGIYAAGSWSFRGPPRRSDEVSAIPVLEIDSHGLPAIIQDSVDGVLELSGAVASAGPISIRGPVLSRGHLVLHHGENLLQIKGPVRARTVAVEGRVEIEPVAGATTWKFLKGKSPRHEVVSWRELR